MPAPLLPAVAGARDGFDGRGRAVPSPRNVGTPPTAPARQAPAGQAPAGQAPAGQAPAGQAPAGQAPAGQAPAGQAAALRGPLAVRLQQAGAVRDAEPRVTLAAIVRALEGAEATLTRLRPRTGLEDLLEHPLDAFFAVQNLVQDGETWRDLAARIELSPEQIRRSEHGPVTLAPLNVALYRGCLFPDAYFMRSTLYWNEVREQLAHVGSFDIRKFTQRMPFIDLRGHGDGGVALADGSQARVHVDGGSRHLLTLLQERADATGHITAYRGCARSEVEIQRFVRELLQEPHATALLASEWAHFDAIGARFGDDVCAAVAASVPRTGTRAEVAAAIADVLGGQNQATFVGFDAAKAEDFQDAEPDPRTGESSEVIVRYRLPVDELTAHVEAGTLYLGIEFDALEAGFGENVDAADQATKLLLYRNLVDDVVDGAVR
jgi:hypothetical protein